jgi:thymidylate synthase
MNKLDKDYQDLLRDILENGTKKQDRTGTGTLSVFGRQLRHDFRDGFPLLTTKRMAFKQIVTELIWFLRGDTNIKFLVDNDCHIWDGDAYKNFIKTYEGRDGEIILPPDDYINDNGELISKEEFINKIKTDDEFAKKWGELGPVYGRMWRAFDEDADGGIDQITNLINDLKTNPDSRRLLVTAWNPTYLPHQVLPPCHYGFQVYTRELSDEERIKLFVKLHNPKGYEDEKITNTVQEILTMNNIPKRAISLMWNQRSCDFPLGIPANIMSYAILLMMLAKQVNMIPEELIGNFGDCHIYLNQIDGVKEQVTREPYPLPSVKLSDKVVNDLSEYTYQDIILENYQSHPKIYFPLSN